MKYNYHKEVFVPVLKNIALEGEITIPAGAQSIVIFSHGSGSSRKSPRNQAVALRLHQHNIGTLLFDLLTGEEDKNYYNRFNIDLLTERLIAVTEWLIAQKDFEGYKFGFFGASTGAAAALKAAAILPQIDAIVSRGGRPDLAMEILPRINVPVLLIVGGRDYDVILLMTRLMQNCNVKKN